MSKAFVREDHSDVEDGFDDEAGRLALPVGSKNYVTPQGHLSLKNELLQLLDVERPELVRVVAWAASNGDRSENGDYLYGKRRLREIDRRIRFLTQRLDRAEVVDPRVHLGNEQVFFGARVEFLRNGAIQEEITIVGVDEVDPSRRWVSWVSPIARTLIKARVGDVLTLRAPHGVDDIEILKVDYGWQIS